MLLLLAILVAGLHLAAPARAALEDCPVDESRAVDDKALVKVLRRFYDNLNFTRACTRSRQAREYKDISDEIKIVFPPSERAQVRDLLDTLKRDRYLEAHTKLGSVFWNARDMPAARSYVNYFKAEAHRLLGIDASSYVWTAWNIRRSRPGLSVNELARLDGLVTLQRVSRYNQQVDMLFGLADSPDYDRLRSQSANETFAMGLLSGSKPRRADPDRDDLTGQSVARGAVEAILSEFAQKLVILGADKPLAVHHSRLLAQMRALDPRFASTFRRNVMSKMAHQQFEDALVAVVDFWSQFEQQTSEAQQGQVARGDRTEYHVVQRARTMETFAKHFRAEIMYMQSLRSCDYLQQAELLVETVKQCRSTRPGVSLKEILVLEGKLVFLAIRCFNRRVKVAYQLRGDEDRRRLALKRIRHGSCRAIVPPLVYDYRQ